MTAAAYGAAKESGTGLQPVGSNSGSPTKNEEPGTKHFTPTQTFAYDPAGNRTSVTDAGMTTSYQTNEANQYTRIESSQSVPSAESVVVEPSFDKLGNLLQDNRNTYTWDADIHLLSVSTKTTVNNSKPSSATVSFKYDALHRRVARIESHQTTLFVMDAWNVIQEQTATLKLEPNAVRQTAAGSPQGSKEHQTSKLKLSARHTWGEDLSGSLQGAGGIGGLLSSVPQPLQTTANNSQPPPMVPVFMHYDSNGNVILLTDRSGRDSAGYTYDAFGQTMTATGITAHVNKYLFSTKPVELGSGLAYYGYRYYDPASGRWLSKDPYGEKGGINLLVFIQNSPQFFIDYLGKDPVSTSTGTYVPGSESVNQNCIGYATGLYDWQPIKGTTTSPSTVPPKAGCSGTSCEDTAHCPCGQSKAVIYENSANPVGYHGYKQDDDGSYSCKYGEGPVHTGIQDPIADYQAVYQPSGTVSKTCWCCPAGN